MFIIKVFALAQIGGVDMKEVIYTTHIFGTYGSDIYLEYIESISGDRMCVGTKRIEKIEYVKPLIVITLKEEVL